MASHLSLHSMQKFSYHQNMDISDEDDDDYPPTITKPRKAREFIVKDAPQAVVEWYMISLDKKAAIKKSEVKEHALGHLLAMGWEFFYIQKKTREELRYKAPNGRVYISLRMACKAYMEEQGVVVSDQMTQMNDSQPEKETPSEQDLGNEKPQPRKAAKGTSPRNPPTTDLSVHYNVASKPEKQTRPSSFEELKSPVLPEKQIPPEKGTPASSFENPKDEYELVKSPVLQSEQDLRNKKPQPRKAAKGTSRRNQRTALSYLMDHELISPGDRVHCNVTRDGRLVTWRGSITNEGFIKCDCCSNLFPISKFEAHTGSTKHRPAANIFWKMGDPYLTVKSNWFKILIKLRRRQKPLRKR
uniref:Uncharacterized protein n=1 Tax=Cucumis melo TaxID=3656 RepID=A0A9I9DDH4_CUCME